MEALVSDSTSPSPLRQGDAPSRTGCHVAAQANPTVVVRLAVVAIIAITVASLILRLGGLDSESLWIDEIRTVNTFRLPFSAIPVGATTGLAQPPLDNFIGAVVHRVGLSGSDWWVRFSAALFGTLSVAAFGMLLLRACSVSIAIGGAALLAVCPLHVAMSQEARPYAICLFFALLTVWAFSLARERNTLRWWLFFGIVLEAFLQTRWTDPSFVVFGLVAFSAMRVAGLRSLEATERLIERTRLARSGIAAVLAYVCYLPVCLLILKRSQGAVKLNGANFLGRSVAQLTESFAAMFSGFSPQTQGAARPIAVAWLIVASALCLIGCVFLIDRARRSDNERLTVLLFAFLPFPVVYSLVYSLMTSVSSKVQYFLIAAVPVFMCLSAGLYVVASRIARRENLARAGILAAAVAVAVVGMTRFSLADQERIEKRDWRGVMGHLAAHSSPDDCFAVIGADTYPSTFYNGVFARGRYGLMHADFLTINVGTSPEVLASDQWQDTNGTLWILAYRDRMYTGISEAIVPTPWDEETLVLDFPGFELIRRNGRRSMAERLIDSLDRICDELPEGKAFMAPAVFAARYFAQSSQSERAAHAERIALRQCTSDTERLALQEEILFQIAPSQRPLIPHADK